MKPRTRRRLRWLAGAVGLFGALWLLWDTPVVYPLRLLVVLFHELSHGLAAVATGGEIREIVVSADEGGRCVCPGGSAFITLSAGYLGSLAWGALFVRAAGAGGRWSRGLLAAVGATLLVLSALWVRSWLALVLGGVFGVLLLWAAARFRAGGRKLLLLVIGVTSCLYAVLDIKSDVLDRPAAPTDAASLAHLTGVPAFVWGALWILVSVAACGWLLRREWRRI